MHTRRTAKIVFGLVCGILTAPLPSRADSDDTGKVSAAIKAARRAARFDEAVRHAQAELDTSIKTHGESDRRTALHRLELTSLTEIAGLTPEVQTEIARAYTLADGVEASLHDMEFAQALGAAQNSFTILKTHLGESHYLTANSLIQFARVLHNTGRNEIAVRAYTAAIPVIRAAYGQPQLQLADYLIEHGAAFNQQGQKSEAAQALAQALELYTELLGTKSTRTISAQFDLALARLELKDFESALELLQTVEVARRDSKSDPKALAITQCYIAMTLDELGHFSTAEKWYRTSLKQLLSIDDQPSFWTRHVRVRFTQNQNAQRKPVPSVPLPWMRTLIGTHARQAQRYKADLHSLLVSGDYEERLKVAKAHCDLRRRLQGERHWQTENAKIDVEMNQKLLKVSQRDRARYSQMLSRVPEINALRSKREFQTALELCLELLGTYQELFGDHADTGMILHNIGFFYDAIGEKDKATASFASAKSLLIRCLPEDSPNRAAIHLSDAVQSSNLKVAIKEYRKALTAYERIEGPCSLNTADACFRLGSSLRQLGQIDEAMRLTRLSAEIRESLDGEGLNLAESLLGLGLCHQFKGEYLEFEEHTRRGLAIRLRLLGDLHPDTAGAIGNLAGCLDMQGKLLSAEVLYLKALEIHERTNNQYGVSNTLHNMANSLRSQGRITEAGAAARRSLEVYRKLHDNDNDPQLVTQYNHIGAVLEEQGRYSEAEDMFQQALDICTNHYTTDHEDTALTLHFLGVVQNALAKNSEAEANLRRSLEMYSRIFGDTHMRVANGHSILGETLDNWGRHEEAAEFLREALKIRMNLAPDGSDGDLYISQQNVGRNLIERGHYEDADVFLENAVQSARTTGSESSKSQGSALRLLGISACFQGRLSQAEEYLITAHDHLAKARRKVSDSGLERSTFSSAYVTEPYLISICARDGRSVEAWRWLDEFLGQGIRDDIAGRARVTERIKNLNQELNSCEEALSSASRAGSTAQVRKHARDRNSLKLELRMAHSETTGESQPKPATLAEQQATIPPDGAMIAWVDLNKAPADQSGNHWAGILRPTGAPIWVELRGSGPEGQWTDEDTKLGNVLHENAQVRGNQTHQSMLRRLFQLRVAPLLPHLSATDSLPKVKRLVILHSRSMAAVPVELLTDEFSISYSPSPSIAALLQRQKKSSGSALQFLAVGNPVFQSPDSQIEPPDHGLLMYHIIPGSNAQKNGFAAWDILLTYNGIKLVTPKDLKAAVASAKSRLIPVTLWRRGRTLSVSVPPGQMGFRYMDGTGASALRFVRQMSGSRPLKQLPQSENEVDTIVELIRSAGGDGVSLLGMDANEDRVNKVLEQRGREFDILHFATHGTLSRSPMRSAFQLSLQEPQVVDGSLTWPIVDGQITVEQILRTWDLDAELVTLSACQSGMGRSRAGDGLLGFSQALLVAGSRSVVLSLWSVDDTATALLMVRFYENLFGGRPGTVPMRKDEALHEAKQWLRNLEYEQASMTLAQLRGPALDRAQKLPAGASKSSKPYAHPHYWAPFILIGAADRIGGLSE